MKKLLSLSLLALMCASVFAQQVVLTFTGRDADNHFLPLSRVVIGNQTRGWQETIYYPDTTLSFGATGISDYASNGSFGLAQNNPNPFNGTTDVDLTVTEPGAVTMEIADVNGKIVETYGRASLQPGTHQFRINVANAGVYFLTARQNGKTSSVKMVNNGKGTGNGIEYVGTVEAHGRVSLPTKTGEKGHTDNPFSVGDEMVYIGYAIVNGTEYTSQTIHQNQLVSQTFVLNFNVTYVEPTGLATVTTGAVSDITGYTATCTGTVVDDGGYSVIARGICWSASHNPVFNDSHVSGGDGLGSFSCQLTGLTPNTTYYVRAYAVNTSGTAYGNEVEFTTATYGQPCPGTPTLTDIDGNTYNTVQIGTQCWMKENLRTTKYADNIAIDLGSGYTYGVADIAYRYAPNDDSNNVATYGYLYNWKAVMGNSSSSSANPSGVQGICPTGWHVPSDAEWTQLTSYVKSQSAYVCAGCSGTDNEWLTSCIAKALASTIGWNSSTGTCAAGSTPNSNNATGFSALPSGTYGNDSHNGFGLCTYFWSATEYSSDNAYRRELDYGSTGVSRSYLSKTFGSSVRCVRDGGGLTVTTSNVTNIAETSATCGGNVTSDGGAAVTARGVCWNTTGTPTVADAHTTNGTGTGSFTSSITGLTAGTTYYVRAYVTNEVGTAYGQQVSFTTANPCPGTPTLTDVDGNTYNTVQIGTQCWMKENLRTTRYADNTTIALGTETSDVVAYRYVPNNDNSNVATYGYLYNWKAVMHNSSSSNSTPSNVQGICPTGWHVPSDAEWTQLTDYVSSQSAYCCSGNTSNIAKALASTTGWNSSSTTCAVGNTPSSNNATGFSALPVGIYNGSFYGSGGNAYFWSATSSGNNYAWYRNFSSDYEGVGRNPYDKLYGFSVRCLRD